MTKCMGKLGLIVFLLANVLKEKAALMVSPRPSSGKVSNTKTVGNDVERQPRAIARIRSTGRSDIDEISDLLASELVRNDGSRTNFKVQMERLRKKSALQSNLGLRIRAIEEGKRFASQNIQSSREEDSSFEVDNSYHLRYLWSKQSFRQKIQQAAEQSSEPHPWEYHNFAIVPDNPCWLQHAALTAEDIETGEIIGFCEIAMLLCPVSSSKNGESDDFSYGDDYEDGKELCSLDCSPTIVNLVVSPKWRRRGVAKGLANSAERLVRRKWKEADELGLYVEKDNCGAIELYSKMGYQLRDGDEFSEQWYMSKAVGGQVTTRELDEASSAFVTEKEFAFA